MFQNKFKVAEKVVKKQIKSNKFEISYQFNLADVYIKSDRENEAEALYQSLVDDLSPVQSQVQRLGKYFSGIGKYDFALATYNKGKKSRKKGYSYNIELAELYAVTKKTDQMITEYLDLLEYSSGYLKTVQTYLSRQIDFENDLDAVELLRVELLTRAQAHPNKLYYNELLIWYYIQKKEYTGAIIQSKALDQKSKTKGRHTYKLGQICESNKMYDKAKQAYKYVMEFGDEGPFYAVATTRNLEVSFLEVSEKYNNNKSKLKAVATEYENELIRLGKNQKSIPIMERLAKIYAFYLVEPKKATVLLNEAIKLNTNQKSKALTKILLGDVLISNNEIWDASILYMQVANQFEDDKIGHEAKFKNAKVFYYDGEFEYAKAQLDVLKASTTKLIANDAMQLSLLLQDNLGVDSTQAPVQLFANADLLLQQHKYNKALIILDSIQTTYPFHAISDEILYQKGLIYSEQKQWEKAISYFQEVIDIYGFDILADDAIFRIAEIYDYNISNPEKAAEYYKKILFEFSGSLYVSVSRERFRAIKDI